MFKHILVPLDGSGLSLKAGRRAIDLAKREKSRLSAMMACPTYQHLADKGYPPPVLKANRKGWENDMAERARGILEQFAAEAEQSGVTCATVVVVDDPPHHAIVETARENDCDLIVMGSHGHGGVKQLILGSQTSGVLSHSKIPVLVYR